MEGNKERKERTDLMAQGRSVIITVIAAPSAIICVNIFVDGLMDYKKSGGGSGITAIGPVDYDLESDLIVWRGSFPVHNDTPRGAHAIIKRDAELMRQYPEESQMADDEMMFSPMNIFQAYTPRYDEEGKYPGGEPDGYDPTQGLTVSSYDIDKVKNISRDIIKLTESGVEFESELPEYYYTKLNEVKLGLIEKVTASTKERIDIMSVGSGARVGKLLSVILGVFQITVKNPGSESYSYDEYLGTSSWYKTTNITVRLNYAAE